jgi:hypothetical protein
MDTDVRAIYRGMLISDGRIDKCELTSNGFRVELGRSTYYYPREIFLKIYDNFSASCQECSSPFVTQVARGVKVGPRECVICEDCEIKHFLENY